MKILVTGIAGFIGSHLGEALLAAGHTVVGIDSFDGYYARELKDQNAAAVTEKGGKVLEGDLATDDLDELVADADFIFHCAAQPGISQTTSFETYLRNNVTATHRLVEATLRSAKNLKCFVNVATSSVYGRHATDTEETPPKPTSYYGVTKLAAEQLVLAACRDRGLPACSLRLFSVYGPRERPDKLYSLLLTSLINDTEFRLFEGSQHHSRSFTYVDDIVAGFMRVMDVPSAWGGDIFNIGCEFEITTGQGITLAEEVAGKPAKIVRVAKRAGDQQRTLATITKARQVLAYEPLVSPAEGIRRQYEWLLSGASRSS